MNFPVPVSLNLFAAAFLVFILGIAVLVLFLFLLTWRTLTVKQSSLNSRSAWAHFYYFGDDHR